MTSRRIFNLIGTWMAVRLKLLMSVSIVAGPGASATIPPVGPLTGSAAPIIEYAGRCCLPALDDEPPSGIIAGELSSLHPPALGVRHARAVFTLLSFRKGGGAVIQLSFNECCRRYARSNGGRYARAIRGMGHAAIGRWTG